MAFNAQPGYPSLALNAVQGAPMAKVRRAEEPAETKAQILAVARRLFVEQGYEATSMSRIAADARIAPNTIYWHFADKDALLTSVLDELVAEAVLEFQRRKA